MKITLKTVLAAFLLFLSTAAARAEAYIGGSLGNAMMNPLAAENSIDQWNAVNNPGSPDCNVLNCYMEASTSGGLKLFGGYRVNPYFAVEGFVAYLGNTESHANDGAGVDASATSDIRTLGIAIVGMIPVEPNGAVMAKLGVHGWSADGTIDLVDTALPGALLSNYANSGTSLMGGIGLNVDLNQHFAMRVEFEYFPVTMNRSRFNIGMFTVGGAYKF